MKPPYAIGSVPSLSGHAIAYRWRSLPRVCRHRASKPQGSSERVLPWQITMDQLIFASLSHTHNWYEVGMLKVPAVMHLPKQHLAPVVYRGSPVVGKNLRIGAKGVVPGICVSRTINTNCNTRGKLATRYVDYRQIITFPKGAHWHMPAAPVGKESQSPVM